jgi:hypothetical protein
MVDESDPHDPDNTSLSRLRNSAIGPWIASSADLQEQEQMIPSARSEMIEQQEVMQQVGNLIMVDQDDDDDDDDDDDAVSRFNNRRAEYSADDAIVEQSLGQSMPDPTIEITTEPQIVSVIYLEENDQIESQEEDVITVSDYSRVLELSHPFEFSLPVTMEMQDSQTSNLENFIEEFEDSLNRIQDLQREINEIRDLYNNLLQEDETGHETSIEVSDVNEIMRDNSQNILDSDITDDESVLQPLENVRSRMDDFSRFFQHLSQENEQVFDEEEDAGFHAEETEDDEESDDLSIVSASWQYENGTLIRHQHPTQIRNNSNRSTNLLPNFYLDSNGIPRIEFERQINVRYRNTLTNDPSSKAAPFCRIDSNGDLECIVAFYTSNSRGELNVEVYDKVQKKADTILFKEIRNNWRNVHGECIGR